MSIQGDDTLIAELATKYNTQVGPRVYQDQGKSAYKGMNLDGELGEFLKDIETGIVQAGDILVVRALDRISRLGLTKALNVYGRIMEAGVKIITTMDERVYSPNDQLSQILATLSFNTANEESEKKSYLTNKYALTRIEQFHAGKRSNDGYCYDIGVGKHPFYIELENKVVKPSRYFNLARELVDMAIQGKGITFCRKYASDSGLDLSHTAMARFFKSSALYGKLVVRLEDKEATRKHPNKEKKYIIRELDGYYPVVATKAEYLRIQKIKQLHTDAIGNRKYVSMLSGSKRLYCPSGYSLIANETRKVKYYRCGYIDCRCGTYVPQYSLNKIVLDVLSHHIFVPKQDTDNHQLMDLEIELEQKTNQFKKRQRMVLDHPDLFTEEAMVKLAEDKAEIEAISLKLEAEREDQATKLSYAGGLTLEHYQDWLGQTSMYLDSTDEEVIQEARDRIKMVVRRIDYDQGLVRIHLADGSTTAVYMPRWKDARKRSYLKLQITDKSTKQGIIGMNEAMKYVCFTEQDLQDGKHIFKAEVYPDGLLKSCSKPFRHKQVQDTSASSTKIATSDDPRNRKAELIDAVKKAGAVLWKRKDVMALGVKSDVWQEFKELNMTAEGFFVYDVNYKTKAYVKKSNQVVSVKELDESDLKEFLMSPKIDSFQELENSESLSTLEPAN
ncbi:hypothetical protein GLP19_10045 [Photobacterium carnosum]|nr:hypothetical protein [Photobacterium carnosum]